MTAHHRAQVLTDLEEGDSVLAAEQNAALSILANERHTGSS